MDIGAIIVWLIVGALAGSFAGMLVARKKAGLGRWTNLGIGLVGALLGGFLFDFFKIDLGLGDIKVTFEDLIAAFCGALLLILIWWAVRKFMAKKKD